MAAHLYAKRLQRGDDLRKAITAFVIEKNLDNASVVTAVGSLSRVVVRMAGAQPDEQDIRTFTGHFEIVSLIGTVDKNGQSHIHISFSDQGGTVVGGHLKDGSIIDTTVELALIADDTLLFKREIDSKTGFEELSVEEL